MTAKLSTTDGRRNDNLPKRDSTCGRLDRRVFDFDRRCNMTTATFEIRKDHLNGSRTGETYPLPFFGDDLTRVRVELFDDDGIKYYSGSITAPDRFIDECVEHVYDWGAVDSGTTRIDVDGETVIG